MAFSVNDFRAQMIGDGARPNLFEMSMPFPGFSQPGNAQTKLTFMCKTAHLPASIVAAIPVSYFGRELKFAGNRTFSDLAITIINDEDFSVRNAFERWLVGINSHSANLRDPSALPPIGYTTDASIIQYGKTGNIIKSYKFIGAFPTEVSQIDVDWGANDHMEEFTVNLAYQWWEAAADNVI